MTDDRLSKVRTEIERRKKLHEDSLTNPIHMGFGLQKVIKAKICELTYLLSFIDSMQEEPTGSITSKQADKLIEQSKEIRKQLTKDKLNSMLNNALSKETKESLNEWLDKKNFRERYKRIAQSEQFKKTHEGMSIGEVIPIEDEEPASKVWHDARETPESDKTILLIAPNGNSSLALWDGKELKSCTLGGGHSVLCSNDKWAYISDILKL